MANLSQSKEYAPGGANSFLKELTYIGKEGNYENGKVAFPENVPDYLNALKILFCEVIFVFILYSLNNRCVLCR